MCASCRYLGKTVSSGLEKRMSKVNSIVGVDVGTSSIKGVEMTLKRGEPTITRVHSEEIPPGLITHNSFIAEEHIFNEFFQRFWKNGKFSTKNVSIGINGDSSRILTTTHEFPWSSDEEFEEIFRFGLEEFVILDNLDHHYFGFHTLREYPQREIDPEDRERHIIVPKKLALIVGVEKVTVDRLIAAAQAAKIRPLDVDISALALARSYTGPQAQENYADVNIDLGADSITIAIHKFGQPIYIRAASDVGGYKITEEIMETFGIPYDKAEARKKEAAGFNPLSPTISPEEATQSVFDIDTPEQEELPEQDELQILETTKAISERHLSAILRVIRQSFDTFIDGQAGSDLTRLAPFTLSGGVAATPGLKERIASEFRNTAELATPISDRAYSKNISDDVLEREHEFAIATGLAAKMMVK